MIKLTIEENEIIREFKIPRELVEVRELRLLLSKSPILIRNMKGEWLYKARNCNYCGMCCVLGNEVEDLSEQMIKFGYKEMEDRIVCKYLEKVRFVEFDEDIPMDENASEHRTLGSPLKSKKNAEVFLCRNARVPFACSSGPVENINVNYCTLVYSKLPIMEGKNGR